MENENQNLIAALRYHDLGFSVIPIVGGGKVPLIEEWKSFQTTRASKEQIEGWFRQFPKANVGVVTGALSGIVVVDVEAGGDVKDLPTTVISKTGGGGWHFFYKHPSQRVQNGVKVRELTDIRGDGGYVVMPPSLHKSGNHYEWSVSPEESDYADLPKWVLDKKSPEKTQIQSGEKVLEGTRNSAATQIAGKMLGAFPKDLMEFAWGAMKEWNQNKCVPPLPENELRATFNSIYGREVKKRADGNVSAKNNEIKAIKLAELVAKEFPSPQWLVEKLIPHEAVTILSGAPASYKTFITLEVALKVAGGGKVFGEFQTTKCSVLIVDEENNQRELKKRIKLLSQDLDLPIFIASKNGFMLGENGVKKVVEYARAEDIKVVIFDSFICIHDANEDKASEMRNVMKYLKEIANHGIAVIVIHHHRKKREGMSNASQDIRGSSDILAQVDCHLAVDRKDRDASITIQQSKLREAQEMDSFKVNFRSDGDVGNFEYVGKVQQGQSKRSELKNLIKKVLETTSEPLNRTQLWAQVQQAGAKGGEATFKTAIKEMVDGGELFSKKGAKNSTLYSLKSFGADDG